jgi:hypothetical protein
MIERCEVDGRLGFATFVDERMQPVERDKAALVKIVFDDGSQLILNAQSQPPKK